MNCLSSGANINLTKPDKYVTILIKAYCTKTVGGSNLPPEMEVSNMSMMEVFYLLNLIINTSPSLSLILSNHVLNSFSASDWNNLIFAINSV